MTRARQAERTMRTLESQRATTLHALRNTCNRVSEVLPIPLQNPDTIDPRSEDTIHAGPMPPRTRAEISAFRLNNIISNVVEPIERKSIFQIVHSNVEVILCCFSLNHLNKLEVKYPGACNIVSV